MQKRSISGIQIAYVEKVLYVRVLDIAQHLPQNIVELLPAKRPLLQTTRRKNSKIELVCTRAHAGLTNREIADELDISINMVRSYKARFCTPQDSVQTNSILGPHARQALCESYYDGMTTIELAEEYNIPERKVVEILAEEASEIPLENEDY